MIVVSNDPILLTVLLKQSIDTNVSNLRFAEAVLDFISTSSTASCQTLNLYHEVMNSTQHAPKTTTNDQSNKMPAKKMQMSNVTILESFVWTQTINKHLLFN